MQLYDFLDECKQGLHSSEFASRLMELIKVRSLMRDVVQGWQFASCDFCKALDEEEIFAEELKEIGITGPSELLSHIQMVDQQIMLIDDMLFSYIDEYFNAGIVIEEKTRTGEIITQEEYENFEQIKNKNPIKGPYMANALTMLNAKCYIDALKTLTNGEGFGILDQVDQILTIVGAEFKTYFRVNSNTRDNAYLKYLLVEVGENGVSHILYDPSIKKDFKTRNQRTLNERRTTNPQFLDDSEKCE